MIEANALWGDETEDEVPYEEIPQEDEFIDPDYSENEPEDSDNEPENSEENETEEVDLLDVVLKSKGFKSKDEVVIINDEGEEETVKFHDLPVEDQIEILKSNQETPQLEAAEVEAINFMRENKLTLPEIAEYYKQIGAKEALEAQKTEDYSIDDYTDEELFVADLKARMPELSDDELMEELEFKKGKPELFAKQCSKIREEYKQLEEAEIQRKNSELEQAEQQEFEDVVVSMNKAAASIEEINGAVLDDEDKVEILKFVLDKDANGRTDIIKALDDPDTLYKVAWFLLKGEEAHNMTINHFMGEINKLKQTTKKPQVTADGFVNKPQKRQIKTSMDLFDN